MVRITRIRIGDDFLLDKDHQTQTWTMFVRDPQRTKFSHKLIYRAADNKDVELAWVETEDERIVVTRSKETTAGFEEDRDRPGVLLWKLSLAPREKREIVLAYSVRFPRDLVVPGLE